MRFECQFHSLIKMAHKIRFFHSLLLYSRFKTCSSAYKIRKSPSIFCASFDHLITLFVWYFVMSHSIPFRGRPPFHFLGTSLLHLLISRYPLFQGHVHSTHFLLEIVHITHNSSSILSSTSSCLILSFQDMPSIHVLNAFNILTSFLSLSPHPIHRVPHSKSSH